MENIKFTLLILISFVVDGCAQKPITQKCNEQKLCNEDIVFDYSHFNPFPIKGFQQFSSPFSVQNGYLVNADSTFIQRNKKVFELFSKEILLPENAGKDSLFDFNLSSMKTFSYYGSDGEMDTGICCLDVVSLYIFSFEKREYAAAYCLEYGDNYFPSENIYDEILLLYRIEKKSLIPLISSKQGDMDFKSIGDIDGNGHLDFIRSTNERNITLIYSFELNAEATNFEKTTKYLRCYYEEDGTRKVDCSNSCWY